MIKTITFGDSKVEVNNNNGWMYDYKERFGEDFLQTVWPVIFSAMEAISISGSGAIELQKAEAIKAVITGISTSIELTTLSNILWSMAHYQDESIPGPREWLRELDPVTFDEAGPQVLETILEACVSKKKVEKIMATLKSQSISMSSR